MNFATTIVGGPSRSEGSALPRVIAWTSFLPGQILVAAVCSHASELQNLATIFWHIATLSVFFNCKFFLPSQKLPFLIPRIP